MPYDPTKHSGRLRRLPSAFYVGRQWIHWTMTVEDRKTGWLDPLHHARLREGLCHAFARERLICPAYCLMPDHGHFLVGGLAATSRQKPAVKLLRAHWNDLLAESRCSLQAQPYDHVLTEAERVRGTFEESAGYLFANPVRGGLVDQFARWPYLGSVAVGYPRLDPREPDFYERFWKIYFRQIEE